MCTNFICKFAREIEVNNIPWVKFLNFMYVKKLLIYIIKFDYIYSIYFKLLKK